MFGWKKKSQPVEKTQKRSKKNQLIKKKIHYDAFGNAVPDLPTTRKINADAAGATKMFRITETKEVTVKATKASKPTSVKTKTSATNKKTTNKKAIPENDQALAKASMRNPWNSILRELSQRSKQLTRRKETTIEVGKEKVTVIPNAVHDQSDQQILRETAQHLHHAMHEMHRQFNDREERMEERFHSMMVQQQKNQKQTTKTQTVLMGSAIAASALTVAYLLYIMQSMQTSMASMDASMTGMTQGVDQMVASTSSMSGSMQVMNQSMAQMNGGVNNMNNNMAVMNHNMNTNMLTMNQNVAHMNQHMNSMSRSIQPIGQAAGVVSPVMKMFRSFMPF